MTATQLVQTHGNRVVSGALIVALYVSVIAAGWFLAYLPAQAAPITGFSDVLSVSVPSSASNHSITFTVPTAIPLGGSLSLSFFNAGFTIPVALTFEDVDVEDDDVDFSIADCHGGGAGDVEICPLTATTEINIQLGAAVSIVAGSVIEVEIGTNATAGAAGVEQLTNPGATTGTAIFVNSYSGATVLDNGSTFVAIQPQVTLQATVNDTFSFVVDGCATGGACDIDSFDVDRTSTATLADFDVLVAGTTVTMGSSLSVTSNAQGGFVVTVEQNHDMTASSGADIDCFLDGSAAGTECGGSTPTALAYASPTGTAGSENTYGHLALHSEDQSDTGVTYTGTAVPTSVSTDTNGEWFGLDGVNKVEIWDNDGTGDGVTQDTGHIDVGYRIEVTGLQESGVYTNQLMYIATPTF